MKIEYLKTGEDEDWIYGDFLIDGEKKHEWVQAKPKPFDLDAHMKRIDEWCKTIWPEPYAIREVLTPSQSYLDTIKKWPLI